MIQDALWKTTASSGLKAIPNSTAERVVKESDGTFTITFTNGSVVNLYSDPPICFLTSVSHLHYNRL